MSRSSIELPVVRVEPVAPAPLDRREHDRLVRRAKTLSWLSLAYMTAEGAIAVTAAILASSVALPGFGLDSVIEAVASIIVIWRFTGTRRLSARRQRGTPRLGRGGLLRSRTDPNRRQLRQRHEDCCR